MDRRSFFKLALMGASGLLTANVYSRNYKVFKQIDWSQTRISLRAYRSLDHEGEWSLSNIEGSIPKNIQGRVLRVGPGKKDLFQNDLNHYFDGDSYLQCLSLENGQAKFRGEFIQTDHRVKEQKVKKMLFNEFGTLAPEKTRDLKNNPNVNIVPYGEEFLALSEGGHPSLLDKNLKFKRYNDFKGTLPKNVSFTAHPKFDTKTGKGYTFGVKQGFPMTLEVFEMDQKSGELTQLYKLYQSRVYMIHDMMMSDNYLAFMIAPMSFSISDILSGKKTLADALSYNPGQGNRFVVLEKKKEGRRWEFSLPSSVLFHFGNMYEEKGELVFTSFEARNDGVLNFIKKWHSQPRRGLALPRAIQWRFHLEHGRVSSKKILAEGYDFPNFNPEYRGKKADYLYCAQMGTGDDPFRFRGVSKIHTEDGVIDSYQAEKHQSFGEPIFAPVAGGQEEEGFLFVPGFDGHKDESFMDIVDPRTMKRETRIWLGHYFPIGFHGNFVGNIS
ncbi:MAG: carotenoid oxygenase family protein [Halobacteriovoraceae bacterium]|nr:carotenoid oxygenase family protein [Halobacteriovoraceae bacterium]